MKMTAFSSYHAMTDSSAFLHKLLYFIEEWRMLLWLDNSNYVFMILV